MEVSDQIHSPAALPRGKRPRYPLDRRLGQSPSGGGGEEKKIPFPCQESNPGRSARSLNTIQTEFHRDRNPEHAFRSPWDIFLIPSRLSQAVTWLICIRKVAVRISARISLCCVSSTNELPGSEDYSTANMICTSQWIF
jgi:hypothetical protein